MIFSQKASVLIKSMSRLTFITGLLLGLTYSFIFYAFQYILRETLRLLSTTDQNHVWLLSEDEVFFYNWFFAALALIAGQSICLTHWFQSGSKLGRRHILIRTTVLNDQRFMLNNFLMWFGKIGFLYAIFFGVSRMGEYTVFSFYPNYAFVLVLIAIILFFQSWNTFRLKFRAFRWMLTSLIIIVIGSWGLSKINVVDYQKINASILENNYYYSNDLQLPQVDVERDWVDYETQHFIYVCRDNKDTTAVKVIVDNRTMPLITDGEWQTIFPICGYKSFDENFYVEYRFFIDRRIKMHLVKSIWQDLADHNVIQMTYAIWPTEMVYDPVVYKDLVVLTGVPYQPVDSSEIAQAVAQEEKTKKAVRIKHTANGNCEINGSLVGYDQLATTLFNLFLWNPNPLILYDFDEAFYFQDYLIFQVALKQARHDFLDYYALENYGSFYEDCPYKTQLEIKDTIPLRMAEF